MRNADGVAQSIPWVTLPEWFLNIFLQTDAMNHMIRIFILLPLIVCGCGGDDFSKPLPDMQQRLARSPQENPTPSAPAVAAASDSSSEQQPGDASAVVEPPASNSSTAAPASTSPAPDPTSSSPLATPTATLHSEQTDSAGASPPLDPAAAASAPTSPSSNETLTTSGTTTNPLAETKASPGEKSVTQNSGGLLGSLKGAGKPTASTPAPASTDLDITAPLTRFGRRAVALREWVQLMTRLTHRFYVAATPDAEFVVSSAGEHTLGLLFTQINRLHRSSASSRAEVPEPELQYLHAIPGSITALEVMTDGQNVLIGTADGRLLVRTAASAGDWDLFARDQILFQDEHRRATRVSMHTVTMIRALPNGKLLTADAAGVCSLWHNQDVIHAVPSIQKFTPQESMIRAAEIVSASPFHSFTVDGRRILSTAVSVDGKFGAVICSAETVTVFDVETGAVLSKLSASHFGDTQPVCIDFLPDRPELLAGLADGRILRRAWSETSAPVAGVDEKGEPVDFDVVFTPDVRDEPDSITSLKLLPESRVACVGTLNGTVAFLDTVQRRVIATEQRHAGAVIDVRITSAGILSLSDDRTAVLFNSPVATAAPALKESRVFRLPTDEQLDSETLDSATLSATDSSTADSAVAWPKRSERRATSTAEVLADVSLAGIRPLDTDIALFGHQLRSAVTKQEQEIARRKILDHLGGSSSAFRSESVHGEPRAESGGSTAPPLLFQATTAFQYSSSDWKPLRLAVDRDGLMAVTSYENGPGVELWDLPTGLVLRRWDQIPTVSGLAFNDSCFQILSSGPGTRLLTSSSGRIQMDPVHTFLTSAVSGSGRFSALGHFGEAGVAAPVLTRIAHESFDRLTGHEMFESMVTALRFSEDEKSLFAAVRSRDAIALQEIDPRTLTLRQSLTSEKLPGEIPADPAGALDGQCGITCIHATPSADALVTFGHHEEGPEIRLWRKSGPHWPAKDVVRFQESTVQPDRQTSLPLAFVNHLQSRIAVITDEGLTILNSKRQRIEHSLPIDNVNGHRPASCFTPDERWFLAGDGDGTIWAVSLVSPSRKALKFKAHSGPISGLVVSQNGKFLLTAGEDNRLRLWSLDEFIGRSITTPASTPASPEPGP